MIRSSFLSAPAQSDPDAERLAAFRAARRLASGLLLGMTGGLAVTTALPAWHWVADTTALQILRSGARAGVVGGIADWFAVTALFRRPWGLPIPHTAILPQQKDRLGEALGRFVATQFFTEADVTRALEKVDLPRVIADTLRDENNMQALARTLRLTIPGLIDQLEDGRAVSALERALPVLLQGEDTARLAARSLRALVDSELHQEVLSFLLAKVKSALQKREPILREFIEARVREQGGRVLGWAIGASVAGRVLSALNMELERVDPRDSSLREGFTVWVRKEIDRIEYEPARRAQFVGAVSSVFAHDSLRAWSSELWVRLRNMMQEDLARDEGWSAAVINAGIEHLVDEMASDGALRNRIAQGAALAARRVLPTLRDKLSHYIASVVTRWDEAEMAERLEQRVGRDLQYIRINGTLVGFLAGAALDVISRLFFGVMP
ncbi:hypothetical protein AA101099_0991 [Neoasaia chiangmaiensis NBRC 101099]|uniref:DUF445 domain-containing protein n=1 Tax=Neoasaia chiangmaiensis TaxID=320497 RepID=UPI00098A7797|nr:DUF445 domain-containing protein [Neoasaia chiangmaiensis]GBR38012.1 hypothetical protein AA101099_0991 [Neoasaia chiangmaiensis NBRC 101099]GEN15230.1 membrane protein [Neoasaia chiangmaiensis]